MCRVVVVGCSTAHSLILYSKAKEEMKKKVPSGDVRLGPSDELEQACVNLRYITYVIFSIRYQYLPQTWLTCHNSKSNTIILRVVRLQSDSDTTTSSVTSNHGISACHRQCFIWSRNIVKWMASSSGLKNPTGKNQHKQCHTSCSTSMN